MSALLEPSAPSPARSQPPRRRLAVAPYDVAAARTLVDALGVSPVLAQVLVRRGLGDPEAARAFLAAEDRHDPLAWAGMAEAVDVIRRHVAAGTRITVHGDYDVDGVCSTTILVRALRALGADVDWFLPGRIDDGYGLSGATVERLAARGTGLLLTADCAITAVEEVAAARAAGLDVVVTDHHAPRADGARPDAPTVHPALGGYPCPELCAAGVAHKVVEALAGPVAAAADLELVALATVCDVVPLRGENRRLVREGLRALAATRRPGLRALMAVSRVDPGQLDASALGFRLGPRINAAGRLHRADAGVELLLCEDPERAAAIAGELDAANLERRAVEERMRWEAEAQVAELGERPAYVLAAEGWHPGVVGIVASRIAERHHRPAVLIALDGDEGTGSARSIPAFDLLGGLHACSGELGRYGGHRAAAGLSLSRDRLDAFRAAFEAHAAAALAPEDLVPVERVDAVVSGGALGLELGEELARLEPCGAGNPAVTLLVPAARCTDARPMGEGRHLRFSVEAGGARARAVAFGCDGRLPVEAGAPCDLTVRLECREYKGAVEPRLVLREAWPCAAGEIAVLGPATAAAGPEGDDAFLTAAFAAAGAPDGDEPDAAPAAVSGLREVVDRRGAGPAGVLVDLAASGEGVLAVVADVPRRLGGLRARLGGFAVCDWTALAGDPSLARPHRHVVALDPPAGPLPGLPGGGMLHLAWGDEERAFAERALALEHDLRVPLAALYRALRERGPLAGAELAAVLRGPGAHPRPADHAGRLLRVLAELGLVALDPGARSATVASGERTDLERSPTFRAAQRRLADGRAHLERAGSGAPAPAVAGGPALPRAA
jgi:single-stranded-DNA-specific exonuclease